jgi:hypothetical protein
MATFLVFLATAAFFWALGLIDRRISYRRRIARRVADIAKEG